MAMAEFQQRALRFRLGWHGFNLLFSVGFLDSVFLEQNGFAAAAAL
ncbi:MAG: hypothetical protein WDN46_01630 [Methylocella sp.]